MGTMHAPGHEAPVVEPIAISDTFVSKLHAIEQVGPGLFRFILTVDQRNLYSGDMEQVIVSRIVVQADTARAGAISTLRALGQMFMCSCIEGMRKGCH